MRPLIWTYWHQGFDCAPYLVKKSIEQLQYLHPEATIHLMDQQKVYGYAETIPVKEDTWDKLSLPHQSDLLRTQILIKYGGIWLDPTVYCLRPLEDWLPAKMENGLFLFHRPGRDRIISNWFIAAEKNNYLLQRLYETLIEYWSANEFRNLGRFKESVIEYWCNRLINGRHPLLSQLWLTPLFTKVIRFFPYMIYHYMFYYLLRTDSTCRRIYNNMSKVSADGPHRLQRLGLLNPLTREGKSLIDSKEVPLHKLKWQIKRKEVVPNTHLSYLLKDS